MRAVSVDDLHSSIFIISITSVARHIFYDSHNTDNSQFLFVDISIVSKSLTNNLFPLFRRRWKFVIKVKQKIWLIYNIWNIVFPFLYILSSCFMLHISYQLLPGHDKLNKNSFFSLYHISKIYTKTIFLFSYEVSFNIYNITNVKENIKSKLSEIFCGQDKVKNINKMLKLLIFTL